MGLQRKHSAHEAVTTPLLKQYRDLSDKIVTAIKNKFPIDSTVHWERRGCRQEGHVMAYIGFSASHMRLRVFNLGTSKVSDVCIHDIEEIKRCFDIGHSR